MAEQQTIKYVPRWNNMTVDNVTFQTNNVVGLSKLGSDYTQDENFRFLPGILSNSNFTKDPSKVTDIELTAHMFVENSQKDSVSPRPLSAKPKKVKSQTVTYSYSMSQGLRFQPKKMKSQTVTPTLPKSQGPQVPGALSKKSKRPKSKKPPTKIKVDQTKSTRLRYQSLTEKKGKPSHEGELDTQPLVLSTYADMIAFLLSDDEAQESEEDILRATEEMDEEP
ncbi:hypothetical protein Tco_0891433 [Tanacetum coccineum]|uniref:Uncharacterized protein n=1 Tax=Tanacetum coccineum TaxID=301880 RepID=A0ABQ5C6A2_9ASTR